MSDGRPPRAGRLRRWLLRPAVWGLTAAVLLLLAAWLLARGPWVAERARRLVVARVSEYLDREVSVGSLRVELLPFSVEARDIRIAGAEVGELPVATADRLLLEADPRALLAPTPTVERLRIEGARLRVLIAADGSHNLPLPRRRGVGGGRQVVIEALEVADGELLLDELRLPLSLAARQVEGRLVGAGPVAWVGTLSAQEVETQIAELAPYLGGVAAKVRIERDHLELLHGRLAGPDLAARLSGRVTWRGAREVQLEIDAEAQGSLLARLGWSDQIAGPLRFTGGLSWTPGVWGARGRLSSPALALAGRPLSRVESAMILDRGSLRLEGLEADYQGGRLLAGVDVAFGDGPAAVVVQAELEDSDVAATLADQGIPIRGLAGRLSGAVEYRCTADAPRAGHGWAELRLTAESTPIAGDLPVAGSAPLLIADGVVSTQALQLTTPAAALDARGALDLDDGRGAFEFTGTVADAGWLLAALDPTQPAEPPLWRPQAGHGTMAGTLEFAPGDWRLRSEFDLVEVTAPGYAADRLRGVATLDAEAARDLRLELARPQAALLVTGTVPFDDHAPLEVAVEAAGWPWQDVAAWLPFTLPVDGAVDGSLTVSGSLAALAGRVDAAVAPAEVAGLPVDRIDVLAAFGDAGLEVERLLITTPSGEVRATGTMGAGETGALDLRIDSTPLDLALPPWSDLAAGPLAGRLAVTATLTGTTAVPELHGTLAGSELVLADRPLGEDGSGRLSVDWSGGELAVAGELLGLVTVGGGGRLADERVDLAFDLATDDPLAVARLVGATALPAVSGRLAGTLAVRGRLADPAGLAVDFIGDELALVYEGRELALLEPARVGWRDGALAIDSLYLGEAATGSELFLFGRLPLDGSALDLKAQIALDTRWLEPWLPGWRLGEGRFEAIGVATGTFARPLINGQGEIDQSSVTVLGFPSAIEEVTGWLLFDPGRVVVDSFVARFGGGRLRAGGAVDLYPEAGDPGYELQLSAVDITVRYPEGWLLRGSAEASLASTATGHRLRGLVDLDRAYYIADVPVGIFQLLQGFFARRRLEVEETDELLAATELNLVVSGADALRVRNNVATLDGDIDLTVRGSLARPIVFGSVTVEPEGTLVYAGNRYVVERGELSFANPYRIEPILDLVATTELREYDVTLTLAGTLERLEASVVSDPPLADLDVLALVSAGDLPAADSGSLTSGEGPTVSARGLLYGQAASAVSRRFERLFGLDKFRIDPLTETSGDLSAARFTVGEQLSSDLFVTYSYDPSTTDQQILQLEWQLHPALTLIATQNGDGSYALDVRWQKSF